MAPPSGRSRGEQFPTPGARLAGRRTVRLRDIRWLPKHQTRLPARPGSLVQSRRCFLEEPSKFERQHAVRNVWHGLQRRRHPKHEQGAQLTC